MKRNPVLFVLSAALVAGLAFLLLRRSPPVTPPVALHPSPRQVQAAQRHLEALVQPQPVPTAAQPRDSRPAHLRTLRLTEEDLNVTLAGSASAQKMLAARHVQAVQIVLAEPANLTVRVAVSVNGHPQNIQLDGVLAPDPKRGLRYTTTHAQVGRFPLPPAVVTHQADALAARFFAQMQGHLPLTIQSVRVEGKTLLLTGLPVTHLPVTRRAAASPRSVSPDHR